MSLSELQRRVATIVLSLPEASGFALAGGAALILHGLVNRETRDLDCFGPSVEAVDELAPAAVAALRDAGFEVSSEQANAGFVRLRVSSCDGESLVDLGFDPATLPLMRTDLGAVRALADLAGDKLLALFSRAAPRDFVDVAGLLSRFSRDELVEPRRPKTAASTRSYSPTPSGYCQRSDGTDSTSTNPATKRCDECSKTGAPTFSTDARESEGRAHRWHRLLGCSARAVGQKPPNDDGHLGSPTPASWPRSVAETRHDDKAFRAFQRHFRARGAADWTARYGTCNEA